MHASGLIGSDFIQSLIAQTPLGRGGQPEDIAPVAVFLASDDSNWVTGEHVIVSGGLTALGYELICTSRGSLLSHGKAIA